MDGKKENYFVLSPFRRCRKDSESGDSQTSSSLARPTSESSTPGSDSIQQNLASRTIQCGQKSSPEIRSKPQPVNYLSKVNAPFLLIITNLHSGCNAKKLRQIYSIYGKIKSVQTYLNKTGGSTGRVDIIYCERRDALAAYIAIKRSARKNSHSLSLDVKIVPLRDNTPSDLAKKK